MDRKQSAIDNRRLYIFLALTFVITYVIEIGIILPHTDDGNPDLLASVLKAAVMFVPAVCVLITRIATHEGFGDSYINPRFSKVNAKYYLLAWLLIPALIIVGAVIYYVIFANDFSAEMPYMVETYQKVGVNVTPEELRRTLISQSITSIILAPVLNCITCFGEEWGWRGYLLPKLLKKHGTISAIIISGLIWGLWHAPIIVGGHNYGVRYAGYPYLGLFAMCIFCIVIGIIFSYITIRTGSCIPAVVGHGALNGFASAAIAFSKDGGMPFIGPACTGLIGGLPLIVLAAILLKKLNASSCEQSSQKSPASLPM